MGAGDGLRFAVFFCAVALVYVSTAVVLVRRMWRWLRRRPRATTPGRRWFERTVLALALLGVGCGAWGLFVEPYRLTVTRVRIESAKVPKGTRPIRVVHLTDLHCDAKPRLEERLPDAVAAEKPDLIVFTGDAVNSNQGAPVFQRLMGRLSAIAPTFGVDGNWDVWVVPGYRYHGTGAERLDGRAMRVVVAGVDVWVAGVGAGDEHEAPAALAQVPPGALTLFLFHYPYPEVVPEADRAAGRVDLMLAGHVHGGQVALPFYGAIVTLSRHGKQYEHGLYDVGSMKLFVSRGIGMEGGSAPRVRFCAPPEIAVIEIAPPE
jgi:uncharacterized protein